ncbi:hypothetical protein MK805_13800 [Shimazuella sp. AN120528]|uniref:hypothetical protein n=1 Tax=Shimazuella soli TaxID=1892854 RepID=UPI001F0F8BAE|nr:hypothetical protein [Shimazuella soli]MCH5586013.1 hypothetical protein [Shimazuella soli]
MDILLYPLFVLGCMVLFFCCFRFFQESPFWGTAWVFFLIIALAYDNLVLLCGRWIGFGETLEMLSMIRYLLHVLLIPTLTFVSLDFLRRTGARWVESVAIKILFNLYTFIVTIIGVFHDFLWVHMEAISINGIDRYIISESPFSISMLFAFVPMIFTSVVVWKRMQWSILFFGCLFVSLLGAIAFFAEYYALGSFTELIFMSVLVLTEYRFKQEDFTSNLFEA